MRDWSVCRSEQATMSIREGKGSVYLRYLVSQYSQAMMGSRAMVAVRRMLSFGAANCHFGGFWHR